MPSLKYLGETFDCTTAIKGDDYIHLLDENGIIVASFDGITDFTGFTLENGSYTSPTADHDCYLAVIRDDGTIGRGSHTCADVGNAVSGIVTGNLTIDKLYPSILLNDSGGKGAQTFIQNANHITWITTRNDIGDGDNYRGIIVSDSEGFLNLKDCARVVEKINGTLTYYNVYGEHNKPTAADVGAPTLESNGRINGAQACSSIAYVTAATRTLTESDIGKTIVCYNSTNKTITIPAGLPVGTEFEIVRYSAGTVTIAGASGVILNSVESARTIKNQYGVVSLKRIFNDSDSWLLVGDLG